MWSWHLFCGLHFGVEFYTGTIRDRMYDYFIIDLGCIRIQRADEVDLSFIPEENIVDSGPINITVKIK
jgi:hypothetical protein